MTLRPAGRRLAGAFSLATLVFATAVFAAPSDENQVIVPKHAAEKSAPIAGGATGSGVLTVVAVLALAGAGAWLVWRGRGRGLAGFNRTARNLAVEETRSLGNRQFLVVASYQDKKFLLGVCPGRIDLLAPLNESAPEKSRP